MSATVEADAPAQPFVKWAGGKRSLLKRLLHHAPKQIGTYHEPFVGGGALFFALRAESRFAKARLNDANDRLARTYRAIQKEPESVIRRLRRMPNDAEFFAKTRARNIDAETHAAVASWFIYLNKTCFNGLYRVNRSGDFNAPFGRYEDPPICDAPNLRAASRALEKVVVSSGDFMYAMAHAKHGDFVYCDPPYMPRTGTEFTNYGAGGFTLRDQERLADTARTLKEAGVSVLLSNSDTDQVRELYHGFSFEEVGGRRSIGKDGFCRGATPDLLIW